MKIYHSSDSSQINPYFCPNEPLREETVIELVLLRTVLVSGVDPTHRRRQRDGDSDCKYNDGPPKGLLANADVTERAYQRHYEKTPFNPVPYQPDTKVRAKHRADGYPSC